MKILTQHPDPTKQGVNISQEKYDAVKTAILEVLSEHDDYEFMKLPDRLGKMLPNFDGSVGWYTTTVKLDLEARGIIERIPKSRPQRIRLV